MKINPEFLPIIEWWEKDGKQTVIWCLIAAIAVGGWYGWKNYRASVKNAASEALISAMTTDELETAATKFSSSDAAASIKIRLAKSYYDGGRYNEAMAVYTELDGATPAAFADIPKVGKAQCLEALGKFADAAKAFDDYAEANPNSYLTLTAQLGAARSYAQLGDKKKAVSRLDALKAANKDDSLSLARIEATLELVNRYEVPKK
jgi:predicted negative regulator of RcsB-dependent stress response